MNTTASIFRILLLSFVVSFFAWAQDTSKSYTLQDCIAVGRARNADLLRSRGERERYGTYKTQAFGQFLPSLSIGAGWTRLDKDRYSYLPSGFVTSRNTYDYSITSSLTLFDGLSNLSTADRSILLLQAAEQGLARRDQDVVFLVQQGFYNALRLRQLVRVNESNLARSRKQLEHVRELNAVGSVPLADVYRQQVQVGKDELALLQAENEYRNALVDLQNQLGLDPREPFDINPAGIPETIDSLDMVHYRQGLSPFDALVRRALSSRPDYRQSMLTLHGAEKGIMISRAGYLPTISAFARYSWSNILLERFTASDYTDFSYGLRFTWGLLNNLNVSTAVQRSKIDREEAEIALAELEREIAAELQKSINTLTLAEKNIDISTRTLRSALEDQRIAQERYTLGAGTLLDLIVANTNLTAAQSDVVNATFQYLTARAQVEYQLGLLSD
ncbi:MAG: TolC family protein [Bacteroidota bacterium]|nr:TolC family protein [Bacteroidota bacterium]